MTVNNEATRLIAYDLYKNCELSGRLWGYRRGTEFVITDMIARGRGTFGSAGIRQMMRDISADEPVTKFRGTHLGGRGLKGAGARQGCPMENQIGNKERSGEV
jgi:hypothetical protein